MASRTLDATPALTRAIESGFGESADGEDRFDAVVGLLAMLDIVQSGTATEMPPDERICRIEGWILGRGWDQTPGEPKDAPGA